MCVCTSPTGKEQKTSTKKKKACETLAEMLFHPPNAQRLSDTGKTPPRVRSEKRRLDEFSRNVSMTSREPTLVVIQLAPNVCTKRIGHIQQQQETSPLAVGLDVDTTLVVGSRKRVLCRWVMLLTDNSKNGMVERPPFIVLPPSSIPV